MDRLERLTNLVLVLLDAGRPLTLAEIVTTVEGYPEGHDAYRQAFERDKRTLREQGIPVVTEPLDSPEQFGYRIRPEDYYLPELDLTEEEQQALNLAVAGVRMDRAAGQEAAWRLGGLGAGGGAPLAALPNLPALPVLHEAIRARATVRFRHRGVSRSVEPYGLLFRRGNWYVVGRDLDREAQRSFRVDRIEGRPEIGDPGAFEAPADFDPRRALPEDPWRIGGGEEVTATVAVDAGHARMVEAEVGSGAVVERRDDGSVVVSLPVVNVDAFRSWVLGLLDHAVVLAPDELRGEIVDWLTPLAGG
ncbi:MAG TPA: WYL domain-containing protein [Acidimicrobiales bacterium]|nr:WYL domain-containing protein [Acidimicrobiales bacterium]